MMKPEFVRKSQQRHHVTAEKPDAVSHHAPKPDKGAEAGLPLFLRSAALSVFPTTMLQRQPVEEEEKILQTKLKVGEPNDIYEQEADRVADTVMRMPDSTVQRPAEEEKPIQPEPLASTITPLVQRQPEPEEEEEILESVPTRDADELGEGEELTPSLESVPTMDAGELGEEEESTPSLESVPAWDTDEYGHQEEEELIQPKSNADAAP